MVDKLFLNNFWPNFFAQN